MPAPRYVPQHADTPDYAKQIKLARTFDQLREIAAAIDGDNTMSRDEKNELLQAGRIRWRQIAAVDPLSDRAPCMSCGEIIECLPDGLPMCEACAAEEAAR